MDMLGWQNCVLALFQVVAFLALQPFGIAAGSEISPSHGRRRRDAEARGAHHRPLTDKEKTDQNLQFMLSLYSSAARPDGIPKQHRKFGSNTVRLLRPSSSSVQYLPASKDQFNISLQYDVEILSSEQLIRASLVHLRSSAALMPPRCHADVMWPGEESLLTTMEPHQRWTEADVGTRVLRGQTDGGPLTLTAQYWCTEQEVNQEAEGPSHQWRRDHHLVAPSLVLYLEEAQAGQDWIGLSWLSRWPPVSRRVRRSKTSPPDTPATRASSSIIADIPAAAKSKTGTPKNRCKLHSYRISFEKLNLGHIYIAPPVYNPRFCQGDCPRVLTYGYHSPNHAIIQTMIHELVVGDVPLPSCVPYKYMPMSVLVVHKEKVEYKELEDMVAESCTCH